MLEQLRKKRQEDAGFTLVELLIVIVIIGILAAVVVLAVGGITKSGSDSACQGSKDAADAASVTYYAGHTALATPWPTSFTDLTGATPPLLKLQQGVTADVATGTILTGKGWTLTMGGGGATQPTLTCAAA
jgi:prepilin-type N-terminal cleavage/methylation domain-containing protein